MFEWLSANISTIAVLLVVLGIVALIIRGMIKNKRAGKSSCSCSAVGGCSSCSSSCCSACNLPDASEIKKP